MENREFLTKYKQTLTNLAMIAGTVAVIALAWANKPAPTPATPAVAVNEDLQKLLEMNKMLIAQNAELKAKLETLPKMQAQPVALQKSSPQPPAANVALPPATPEEYLRRIQEIAGKAIVNTDEKDRFLKAGSKLIQQLEEAAATRTATEEAMNLFEQKAQTDENSGDAEIKLTEAKKKLAEADTLIAQYTRDLDAMIQPYAKMQAPQLTQPAPPPENRQTYSNLRIEPTMRVTPDGFLVRVHFVLTNTIERPQVQALTADFNLSTMTPMPPPKPIDPNADPDDADPDADVIAYEFPVAMLTQIYADAHKAWRSGIIKWHGRKPTTQEKIDLLYILTRKDLQPVKLLVADE